MMLAMVTVMGVAAALGVTLAGGPLMVDWSRRRGEKARERQIALTDALDGRFGPMVAPVVRRPLRGPWEVRIAVPPLRPATVAAILAVVADTFDGLGHEPYRVVLRPKDDVADAGTWAGRDHLAAA
jgi:hypothetical protein